MSNKVIDKNGKVDDVLPKNYQRYAAGDAWNIIRDWNKLQGFTHPTDEHIQIRRDLGSRQVCLENSTQRTVGIAIATYICGEVPQLQFLLGPGELKTIGINPPGDPMQFMHLLDPITRKPVGSPREFRTDSNSFVIRDGLNKFYVDTFKRATYSAAK